MPSSIRGRRILVTGGAGFIGSRLSARLLEQGATVRVIDDLSVGRKEKVPRDAEFLNGDVRDPAAINMALDGVELICHLAAHVSVRASMDRLHHDTDVNVLGTLSLLDAARKRGVRRIVFASSMAVYADSSRPEPIAEDFPTEPLSPYGIGKLAAERYLRLVGDLSDISTISLRLFNTFGPGQILSPYVGVINIFIDRLRQNQPLTVFGDGRQVRDFLYLDDAVAAFLLALNAPPTRSGVFNIGSGTGTSLLQLVAVLGGLFGRIPRLEFVDREVVEIRNSIADITKARRDLGYTPSGGMDKLRELIGNQEA